MFYWIFRISILFSIETISVLMTFSFSNHYGIYLTYQQFILIFLIAFSGIILFQSKIIQNYFNSNVNLFILFSIVLHTILILLIFCYFKLILFHNIIHILFFSFSLFYYFNILFCILNNFNSFIYKKLLFSFYLIEFKLLVIDSLSSFLLYFLILIFHNYFHIYSHIVIFIPFLVSYFIHYIFIILYYFYPLN